MYELIKKIRSFFIYQEKSWVKVSSYDTQKILKVKYKKGIIPYVPKTNYYDSGVGYLEPDGSIITENSWSWKKWELVKGPQIKF